MTVGETRGIAFALLSFALFSGGDAVVKWLSATYPVPQIAFFVTAFGLLPASALLRGGLADLRPRRARWVALRSLLLAVDSLCAFFAFSRLPLAEAYALLFLSPILLTALSVPLLGERVGWRRWAAVAAGFAGVLIVLRPGFAAVGLGHAAALAAAFLFASSLVVLRRMGATETSASLLVYLLLALMAVTAPLMLLDFVPVRLADLGLMAVGGLLLGYGHLALIRAFRATPASAIAPFHYSQMLWGLLLGFLVFSETPDLWVLLGGAFIVASGLFILRRERRA